MLAPICTTKILLGALASACWTQPVAMLLLSIAAVSVSRRYPPYVVIHREAAAMRADVRQGNSTHSVYWSDDPSQERALSQNILRNAQASNILQSNIVIGLLKPFNSPFTWLSFCTAFLFEAFPIVQLLCIVRTAHHLGIAICIRTSFDLLQNFFEKRLVLQLTLHSFLCCLCGVRWYLPCPCPCESKISPHSAQKLFASEDLPKPATMSLPFHNLSPFLRL